MQMSVVIHSTIIYSVWTLPLDSCSYVHMINTNFLVCMDGCCEQMWYVFYACFDNETPGLLL